MARKLRTIETIKADVDRVTALEEDRLKDVLYELPKIMSYLIWDRRDYMDALARLEKKRRALYRNLWLYYLGMPVPEVEERLGKLQFKVPKSNIDMFIEADEEYMALMDKVNYLKQGLAYIEEGIQTLKNLQWIISQIVKLKELEGK